MVIWIGWSVLTDNEDTNEGRIEELVRKRASKDARTLLPLITRQYMHPQSQKEGDHVLSFMILQYY